MPRFVILRHEPPPASQRLLHWDFMLEDQGVLLTWALESEPVSDLPIGSLRLPDHRLGYLDYEGPITRDRGTVSRWDAGVYEFLSRLGDWCTVSVQGAKVGGNVELRRESHGSQRWVVTFSSARSPGGRCTMVG